MKLKELEDFYWFPNILRKYQMELIGSMVSQFGLYQGVAKMVKQDLIDQSIIKITDLCSGSGYPAIFVHEKIDLPALETTLTDKFPQQIIPISGILYSVDKIDVNDTEIDNGVYYTMFNAFHHLDNEEQKNLIQKVIEKNANMMIVEIVQPTLLNVVLVSLASTLGVWLLCPLIRPFDWKRILFTYIIPINVFTVLIDGYISILKSKTKRQYQDHFSKLFPVTSRIVVQSHLSIPTYLVTIKISPQNA